MVDASDESIFHFDNKKSLTQQCNALTGIDERKGMQRTQCIMHCTYE